MTASVTLFANSVASAIAENTAQTGHPVFRYNGPLDDAIDIDDLSADYASWFAVATRDRAVTLVITYDSLASQTFVIAEGQPCLVLARDDDTITSAVIAPATDADVEVMVYTSDIPINANSPAFLILNASRGITEDPFLPNSVTAWRDTRAVSLAPLDFDWTDAAFEEPTLIASDPDFGGRPSVSFETAGNKRFSYSGLASVFNFMNCDPLDGGGDWTAMAIMSVPDDAANTGTSQYQGIWSVENNFGTNSGVNAVVDSAYRLNTLTVGDEEIDDDELAPKPLVVIWHYDSAATELRTYWQGRWHAVNTSFGGTAGAATSGVLEVGAAITYAATTAYLRGKIADFRVYNRLATQVEMNAYIALAVSDYGINDTEVQGFPWISSCVNMHRANRGLNWADPEETIMDVWYDTRREVSADCPVSTVGPDESPTHTTADDFSGQPAFDFNGTDQAFYHPFNSTSGDHLGGSSMTITMVYRERSQTATPRGLFTMADYNSATLGGTSIWNNSTPSSTYYEVDNSADANIVYETGPTSWEADTQVAMVFRGDGTTWWIDEYNIGTGERQWSTGSYSGTELTTTSAAVIIGAMPSSAYFMDGLIFEYTTAASSKTNAEVLTFFEYAAERYGAA